ncbi:hypothetical protein HYQ46_003485 [Verticillium longisporum]|nr:hypothetical protein HYQ44_007172 [Verticillium longisporum]KAG7147662.1 hypothetical protein HYQ46_003485 [Verticillium longisporum]
MQYASFPTYLCKKSKAPPLLDIFNFAKHGNHIVGLKVRIASGLSWRLKACPRKPGFAAVLLADSTIVGADLSRSVSLYGADR